MLVRPGDQFAVGALAVHKVGRLWIAVLALAAATLAQAATIDCTSTGSTWNSAAGWNCGVVPNNGGGNIYNATVATNQSLGGSSPISPTINTLTVNSGRQLDLAGQSLTLADNPIPGSGILFSTNEGTITNSSGSSQTLVLSNDSWLRNSGTISNLTLSLASGGKFTQNNGNLTSVVIDGGAYGAPVQFSGISTLNGVTGNPFISVTSGITTITGTNNGSWLVTSGGTILLSGATLTGGGDIKRTGTTGTINAIGINVLDDIGNFTYRPPNHPINVLSGSTTVNTPYGDFIVSSGATLGVNNLFSSTLTSVASGAGSVITTTNLFGGNSNWTMSAGSTLAISGANTLNGPVQNITLNNLSGTATLNGALTNATLTGPGTFNASAGATVALGGASNTTLSGAGTFSASAATLNGVNNNVAINIIDSASTITGTSTNTGAWISSAGKQVSLNNASLTGGTLGGTGTFMASGSNVLNGGVTLSSGTTLALGGANFSNTTISGGGLVTGTGNFSGATNLSGITNQGTINVTGGTLTLSSVTNSGATYNLSAGVTVNASGLSLNGGALTGAGTFNLSGSDSLNGTSNSALVNILGTTALNGTALNSGTFAVGSGATLTLNGFVVGGNVTTAATGSILTTGVSALLGVSNPGAANYSVGGYLSVTGSDWDLGGGNTTAVQNGGSLVISGNGNNAGGTLTVNTGGVFQAANYTQSSGSTKIDGTFQIGSLATPGLIDVMGGTFVYSGAADILGNIQSASGLTIDGNSSIFGNVQLGEGSRLLGNHTISGNFAGTRAATVTNAGVISPGHSPGVDTVNGNYTQTSTGDLEIQLGGISANQYDRLIVNGIATLGGTLNVTLIDGFTPQLGEVFRIITDQGTLGDFATVNMANLGPGLALMETRDVRGISLTVNAVPEPGTVLLIACGLAGTLCWRGWRA